MKVRKIINHLKERIRLNKKTFALYLVLRALVILTAIRCLFIRNYESFALCIISLGLFLMPSLLEEKLRITFPPLFECFIYLFIYAAEILGEVNHYYTMIPGWDTMLHTINGFLYLSSFHLMSSSSAFLSIISSLQDHYIIYCTFQDIFQIIYCTFQDVFQIIYCTFLPLKSSVRQNKTLLLNQ